MRRFYQRLELATGLLLSAVVLALISSSSVLGAPLQAGNVNFTLSPASSTISTGDTVDVTIQFDATIDPVSAAQVYLNFDPSVLQVVDAGGNPVSTISPGSVFAPSGPWQDSGLQNSVNNSTGEINYAGGKGTGGSDATSLVGLATFRFKAIDSTPTNTSITFNIATPRQTKAVSGFNDATGLLTGMTITVLNAAPNPSDDSATVAEGGTVTTLDSSATSLLANDTDPEGDPLTLTTTPVTPPFHGNLTLNANGTFSYTHDGSETTSDSFVYEACDPGSMCTNATVNIVITPVNDVPTAVDDAFTTDEDTAFDINVLSNDTDPDLPAQTLSVQSIDTTTNSTKGLVTNNGDGTLNYDPNGQFEALAQGEQDSDSFIYTLSDGNGGTDTATVTITIDGRDETQNVTFTVSLQGAGAAGSPSWSTPVDVEIYDTGTSNLVTSGNFTVSASAISSSGTFMVSGLAAADYDVWVKIENGLSHFQSGITMSPSSTAFDLGTQLGGDANSSTPGVPDNVVDASDYSGVVDPTVFGQLTSSLTPAKQLYDFNEDGIIDVVDYTILVNNFGQGGDAKP